MEFLKNNYKKLILALVILAAAVVLVIFGSRIIRKWGKTYNTYTVKKEFEMQNSAGASFIVTDKSVVRYTRDGISAFNEDGKEIWNVSYQMSDPIVDVCGDFAAAADKGSSTLYILDGSGAVHNVTTEYKITQVSVGGQGITAVRMDDGLKDYISVYSIDGNKVVDMMTTTTDDGFPVAMDVSEDGTKMVTSYAVYEDSMLKNQITFYNFGELGSNYVDRLVGLKTYTDRLAGVVRFVNNDTVAAFSNKGIGLYSMEVTESDIAEVAIDDEIAQISTDEDRIGVISRGNSGAYVLHIYNLEGKEIEKRDIDTAYKHFKIKNKDVILYGGNSVYIIKANGKDKAKIEMTMDINGIFPVDGKKTYTVVGDQKVQTIVLDVKDEG